MRTIIYAKSVLLTLILSVCVLAGNNTVLAQSKQKTVTGTVTNAANNLPIDGIIVSVKNSTTSTKTNKQGNYSIIVPLNNAVLVFKSTKFNSAEAIVGKQLVVNIKLIESALTKVSKDELSNADEKVMSEVAVLGYTSMPGKVKQAEYDKRSTAQYDYYHASPAAPVNKYPSVLPQDTEEYGTFTENSFQLAQDVPLSTFSIDVDAASYANVRRFINQGQVPPKNAVRTEELINYFNYNYAQPKGKHPINIITEVAECPWNSQNRLVHIGIKAKDVDVDKLPSSNLVFLIDVSGSMSSANRLPLVKSSMKMLVKQLRNNDKVAIVTYAGNASMTLESTSGKDKEKINAAIDKLVASGATAGGEGIKLAYKIAKDNFVKGGNNRIILASDGDFNVGMSSNEDMEQLVEKERASGVYLTVLGYGMGNYKDSKMQVLAQKGNGNHAYIDNLNEAKKVLVTEFTGTLFTIAKDVKLQLEFNPAKVQAYRLIGYESRLMEKEDFNNDTKDAGDMGAGHTVTALYEIIPVGVSSNIVGSVDELKYQKNMAKTDTQINTSKELLTVKIRYKSPDSDTSEKLEVAVTDGVYPLLLSSNNFRFSAAVAQVGMLLHNSQYKSNASYETALLLAKSAYGDDTDGYRHEFVKLVENLQLMEESNAAN